MQKVKARELKEGMLLDLEHYPFCEPDERWKFAHACIRKICHFENQTLMELSGDLTLAVDHNFEFGVKQTEGRA